MSAAPAAFCAELRSHNLHALGGAILSLLAAALAWNLAYFFFVLILLGLETSVRGDFGGEIPRWILISALALAGVLFIWGLVDAGQRRFAPPSDRAIIGWHLISDFLLLPVRLTFAIGGNLRAVRLLTSSEIGRAWELVLTIHQQGKARLSTLSLIEADPARLQRLLATLQLLGYIDLHKGKQDWFYSICSPREPALRALTQ